MLLVITRIYEVSLLIVAVYAIFRFRETNLSLRYLCAFLWLGAVTEIVGKIFVILFHTNLPVYNVSVFIEFVIICLFFNRTIGTFRRSNIGVFIAGLGLLFGVINMVFFQPITVINSNFAFFECLCVVCFSLYAMYKMMSHPDILLTKETYFWICVTFLIYQCASIWNWGIYSYILRHSPEKTILMNISLLIINIMVYCSYFLILLFYPKMRRTDV